jgi:predicted Zn-dependent protease
MSVKSFSEMTYFNALALEQLGKKTQARKLLRELLAYASQLMKSEAKIDYFATSLPAMLLFNDDLQKRNTITSRFLQAQANLGLGKIATGQRLLKQVLKDDRNHAMAADLLSQLDSPARKRRR